MKKVLWLLLLFPLIFSEAIAQDQTPADPFEQLQKEMEKFLKGFNLEEGGMMMDTMLIQPFGFFDGMPEGNGEVPEDMQQQMQQMMDALLKQFQQFSEQQDQFQWDEFFKQMDPDFAYPAPDEQPAEKDPAEKKKKKRKTYSL